MKLSALQTLAAAVSRGSFAAAAAESCVTASAVSLQMKQLEAWFGQPLFDRSGRTIRPTPLAREIASTVSRFVDEVHRYRVRASPAVAGLLRLGAIPSVQISTLPVALRIARQSHRELEVRFMRATSAVLIAAVGSGDIDAAVVVRPSGGGSSRLLWHDLAREPFVLLGPVAVAGQSARAVLREQPWIRYDTSLTGGRMAAAWVRRLCPQARPAIDMADTDAIVAMVAEGLGVSVIPRPRPAMRRGYAVAEIELGARAPRRTISLVLRRGDADNRRIAAMHEALVAAYRETAPEPA
jgi:DNA-binding transcriptional LysR family regulator